jgi:hypothetical protein
MMSIFSEFILFHEIEHTNDISVATVARSVGLSHDFADPGAWRPGLYAIARSARSMIFNAE